MMKKIKGKRTFLANAVYRSSLYRGLRPFSGNHLVIFNYHRIRSHSNQRFLFDDGVYGPTQQNLYDQLSWLKQNANLISEQDLIDQVRGKSELPEFSAMITFDDGYRDNAELALPVLKSLKVPAIFFIATHALESRQLGWWDTIAYLVKQTQLPHFSLRGRTFDLTSEYSRERVIKELQEWMRTFHSQTTQHLLEELSHVCQVSFPEIEVSSRELMTWEQVKEARDVGITIGSHTHTHRVLSTLSLAEQYEEFRLSKEILEGKLKQPIRSVAYPVGGHDDCHIETGELAERCGYQLGFSFQTGFNRLEEISPFGIHRIAAEEGIPLTCAAMMLPSIFARSRCGDRPNRSFISLHRGLLSPFNPLLRKI